MSYGPLGEEISKQRIADRIREAEAERVSRPVAESRMAARRAKAHRVAAALASHVWAPVWQMRRGLAGSVPARPRRA